MFNNYEENEKKLEYLCIPQEIVIRDVQLAASYVPYQLYCGVMPPIESLMKGTAFYELYSPYSKRDFSCIEPEVEPCSKERGHYDE